MVIQCSNYNDTVINYDESEAYNDASNAFIHLFAPVTISWRFVIIIIIIIMIVIVFSFKQEVDSAGGLIVKFNSISIVSCIRDRCYFVNTPSASSASISKTTQQHPVLSSG